MQHPREPHWIATIHILKYLKGCPSISLLIPATNNFHLVAYSNSNWASYPVIRNFASEYCFFLGSSLISYKSKKQTTVSRSFVEVEYRNMATMVCKLQQITYLLKHFQLPVHLPISLHCDSKTAIHIATNLVFLHKINWHICLQSLFCISILFFGIQDGLAFSLASSRGEDDNLSIWCIKGLMKLQCILIAKKEENQLCAPFH